MEERVKGSMIQELGTRDHLDKGLAELKAETIKWMAGMLIAQAALIATLVKLL